ncbi:hypothetical protein FSP39_006911 [Pinctada imbricata]|uniref:G-protein coupled receptors family 1 profile domain-containing protein n=1 Tax=Pinctada imbricata TaxID=66713 RepID=A0AA88XNE4_PINIB|nr:hypothetical protein FSP39_006911 [Pinctada imbricata]
MASTFGDISFVNATGNWTNVNTTDRPKYDHRGHDHTINLISDKYKDGLVAMGSINAVCAIIVNLLLLLTILCRPAMRKSLFYWNIINLCVCGLLSGFVVIPFFTNKFHHEQWFHGADFCLIFTIFEYTQVAFPGMVFICMHIDRFVKVRMGINRSPRMHLGFKILQFVLLVFPWIFVFVICVPILVHGKIYKWEYYQTLQESYCIYIMETEYYTVLLYLMFVTPIIFLIILNIVNLINFKMHESQWKRMMELEQENRDPDSTRSTSQFTMISSAIFMVFWMPFLCSFLRLYICHALRLKRGCFPKELEIFATYVCGMTSSFMRQLPWFLLPDMRTSVTELAQCSLSAFVRKMNDTRQYFSKGPIVVEWPKKQSELMEDDEK